MPFAKGMTKVGGRKPGIPNKASIKRQAEVAASGLTPLEYMLKVLRDESAPLPERMDAAKSAAPYIHPKLAAIEHSGKDGGSPIKIEAVLTDDQRAAALMALLAKTKVNPGKTG